MLTNAQVQAGEGSSRAAIAYRAMLDTHGSAYGDLSPNAAHDALCVAYGLDRDHERGGTYWGDVVRQAIMWGDLDPDTYELT